MSEIKNAASSHGDAVLRDDELNAVNGGCWLNPYVPPPVGRPYTDDDQRAGPVGIVLPWTPPVINLP